MNSHGHLVYLRQLSSGIAAHKRPAIDIRPTHKSPAIGTRHHQVSRRLSPPLLPLSLPFLILFPIIQLLSDFLRLLCKGGRFIFYLYQRFLQLIFCFFNYFFVALSLPEVMKPHKKTD